MHKIWWITGWRNCEIWFADDTALLYSLQHIKAWINMRAVMHHVQPTYKLASRDRQLSQVHDYWCRLNIERTDKQVHWPIRQRYPDGKLGEVEEERETQNMVVEVEEATLDWRNVAQKTSLPMWSKTRSTCTQEKWWDCCKHVNLQRLHVDVKYWVVSIQIE